MKWDLSGKMFGAYAVEHREEGASTRWQRFLKRLLGEDES